MGFVQETTSRDEFFEPPAFAWHKPACPVTLHSFDFRIKSLSFAPNALVRQLTGHRGRDRSPLLSSPRPFGFPLNTISAFHRLLMKSLNAERLHSSPPTKANVAVGPHVGGFRCLGLRAAQLSASGPLDVSAGGGGLGALDVASVKLHGISKASGQRSQLSLHPS